MSARRRAVLDPNIYVAAAITPTGSTRALLNRWDHDDEFDVLWSQKLGYELHQTLYAKSSVSDLVPDGEKTRLFDRLEQQAVLVDDVKLDNPVALAHDPNDDYLVAMAQQNNATLITVDRKVLRSIEETGLDVEAMHPSDFVQQLDRDEERAEREAGSSAS